MITKEEEVLTRNGATDEQTIARLELKIDAKLKDYTGGYPVVIAFEKHPEQRVMQAIRAKYVGAGWMVVETTAERGAQWDPYQAPAITLS